MSLFLQSYINEEDFRPYNSEECVFQYCFSHHYPHNQVKRLLEQAAQPPVGLTPQFIDNIDGAETEEALISHLLFLRESGAESKWGKNAWTHFMALLEDCKMIVFKLKQEKEQADFIATGEKSNPEQLITPDSISSYDIENEFYTGITRTASGNLEKINKSALHKMIAGNRLSRQRIDGIQKK